MIYLILAIAIILLCWKKSKSNFFEQSRDTLAEKRQLLINVLEDRNIDKKEQGYILDIYNIFCQLDSIFKFDGATIVADIDTIKGLDVSAMVHDFEYQIAQHKGFWYYLKAKVKADIDYAKRMRKLGVSWLTAWVRGFFLLLSTPFWILLLTLKGKFKRNIN